MTEILVRSIGLVGVNDALIIALKRYRFQKKVTLGIFELKKKTLMILLMGPCIAYANRRSCMCRFCRSLFFSIKMLFN